MSRSLGINLPVEAGVVYVGRLTLNVFEGLVLPFCFSANQDGHPFAATIPAFSDFRSNRTTAFPFGSPQVKLPPVVLTILSTDDCNLLPFRLLLFYLPFCLLLRLLGRSLLCYCGLLVVRKLVGARLLDKSSAIPDWSNSPMICSFTIGDFAAASQLF